MTGGQARTLARIAEALRARGYDVDVTAEGVRFHDCRGGDARRR